jgi:hypothetical protein
MAESHIEGLQDPMEDVLITVGDLRIQRIPREKSLKKAVLKHGYWSKEARSERKLTHQLIQEMRIGLRS